MTSLLSEELRVRLAAPPSNHAGVADEQRSLIERIRSLVERVERWHPKPAVHIASTGAMDGYAEIFQFPCCDAIVKDFLATIDRDAPSRLRSDGCTPIPASTRYESPNRTNPFQSKLVAEHRQLQAELGPRPTD